MCTLIGRVPRQEDNVVENLPVDRSDVVVRPGRKVVADLASLDGDDLVVVGPGPPVELEELRAKIGAF